MFRIHALRASAAISALAAITWAAPVAAATLIDGTTPGLYNDGIGTVLDGTNPFNSTTMFPGPNISTGDPVLDIPSSSEPDLSAAAAALGSWLTAPSSPGGSWSASAVGIPGTWAINTETAIIYTLQGGATGLSGVQASFGVDNGLFVWLDGVFLGGHLRPGGPVPGEFVLNLGDLSAGTHYLQVLREDHGGATGYDVSVTGEVAGPAVVPLPGTSWLLIAGFGGLAALRRKKRAA